MLTAIHPSPQLEAPKATWSSSSFPWQFLLLAWVILFPYQNLLDPRQEVDLSEIVSTAKSGNAMNQVLAILLGVLGVASLVKYGKALRSTRPMATLLMAYVGWMGISILWADDWAITLRRFAAFALIMIFCAGCSARMNRDTLALFVAGMVSLNLSAAILQELIRGTYNPLIPGSRFGGTISPNTLGASLSVAAIIVGWFACRSRTVMRVRWALIGLVLLMFIGLTGSRTSLIGLAVAFMLSAIVICLRRYRHEPVRIAATVLLFLTVGTAATLASTIQPIEISGIINVFHTERDGDEVTELTGRNVIWEVCSRYAAERPVLGFGYGGFWTGKRLDAVASEMKWAAFHAHSAYLDMLLQSGIPGALLYILLLATAIGVSIAKFMKFDDTYGIWIAVLAFLTVNGLTESTVILPTFPAIVLNLMLIKLAHTSNPSQQSASVYSLYSFSR